MSETQTGADTTNGTGRPKRNCKRKSFNLIEDYIYECSTKIKRNATDEESSTKVTAPNKKPKIKIEPVEYTTTTSIDNSDTVTKRKRGRTRSLNLYRLSQILHSDLKTIQLCQQLGVIQKTATCPTCDQKLDKLFSVHRNKRRHSFRFQCNKSICKRRRNQVCLRENSFFKGIKISLQKGLVIIYCFIKQFDYSTAIDESSIVSGDENDVDESLTEKNVLQTSSETVMGFYFYCREVCMLVIEKEKVEYIGGSGKTVELDTTQFGRRKYSSGTFEDGQWVVTGMCKETKQVFMTAVPSTDDDTLIQAVEQHVLPGTTLIITEDLPLYKALKTSNKVCVQKSENHLDECYGMCQPILNVLLKIIPVKMNSKSIDTNDFHSYPSTVFIDRTAP